MTRLEFNNEVLKLSRSLYLVAYRFLKRQDEAEDAVQEVFLKLWNKREELNKYNSIEALAVTTTKNYCIDKLMKTRIINIESHENHLNLGTSDPSPDETMERNEVTEILNNIIESLPGMYRDVITMREIDSLPYEEIARLTGQNINTLRVNLSRARKMIRDKFKRIKYEYTGNTSVTRKVL
jgi:RNA polymerase sigma factor (sigma-70 family)